MSKIAVGMKCLYKGGLLSFLLSCPGPSSAPDKHLKGIDLWRLMHKLQLLLRFQSKFHLNENCNFFSGK